MVIIHTKNSKYLKLFLIFSCCSYNILNFKDYWGHQLQSI